MKISNTQSSSSPRTTGAKGSGRHTASRVHRPDGGRFASAIRAGNGDTVCSKSVDLDVFSCAITHLLVDRLVRAAVTVVICDHPAMCKFFGTAEKNHGNAPCHCCAYNTS